MGLAHTFIPIYEKGVGPPDSAYCAIIATLRRQMVAAPIGWISNMKTLWIPKTALTLTSILFLNACSVFSSLPDPSLCRAWWTGEIDSEFAEKARLDLQRVRDNGCPKITISLNSPGGYVTSGLETIRLMREAEAQGLIVEVRGGALVASMAVIVMAAGTPGHRITNTHTLVIVHGPRVQNAPWEPSTCAEPSAVPKNEDEKVLVQIINTMIAVLVETTGRQWSEVSEWFKCGNEQVGDGSLLVFLGIADAIEG